MKRKTLLTLVLSLLLAVGVVGGTFAMSPKAVAQESNPEWLSSFTMLAGAEVRTADPNGIRFTTQISASEYNALMAKVESGEYASVEFGTLICPMEHAENGAIKDESNEHVTKLVRKTWDAEYNPTLQTEVYQYNGDLLGLTDADLVREYQALGYLTITPAEGTATTYYANVESEGDNVRTALYVASYNVVNLDSTSDYLLAMIDKAMAGKTLALSKTSASLAWKQVVDFPLVATVDGKEVAVAYYVEDESVAKYEDGKLTAVNGGSTNIVAVLPGLDGSYTAKVPVTVTVDVSRFEGLPSKTITEQNGNRSVTSTLVYEKGVGLWVKMEATHNLAAANGWVGSALNVEINVAGDSYWLYNGATGPAAYPAEGSFDMNHSTMVITENAGEGAKYSTLVVGLLPEATLLANGVSAETIAEGYMVMDGWVAFKSPGEGAFTKTDGTSTANGDMWPVPEQGHVGEDGYFVYQKPIDVSRFEGLEAKTVAEQNNGPRTLSSVMVYEKGVGLWVKVEAQHNVFTKGWGGSGLDLELSIASGTHFIYYGTGGVGFIGFDADASAMRVTENEGEGANYSTLVVGLLTDATLLANGVTQDQLDKGEILVTHVAFKSPGEGTFVMSDGTTTPTDYWYIHSEAYVGENGYFVPAPVEPEPDPEPEITVDLTRFEGLEAKTVAEQDGVRTLSSVMVYEKGVGLWVKVDANHNVFTKGWGGSGLDLELNIGGVLYWLYFDEEGPGSLSSTANGAGFDMENTNFVVTENETGAKYTTLIAGLIPEATLTADGIDVSKGYISVTAAFKSPSEGSFTMTDGSTTATDYWYIHGSEYVTAEGYKDEDYILVSRFAGKNSVSTQDLTGKYSFTQYAYYEKGVGVWMYGIAVHSTLNWNTAFGPYIGTNMVQFYIHNGGSNLLAGTTKSFDQVTIWTEQNADGSYTTSFVGLAKESDIGTKLTDDIIPITPVFENGGAMQVHVQAGAGTSWWQMPTELVDANGFFDGGVSKSVQFTDVNTNKMFSYSAKLNQYGLYLEAEAKSDASANALLMIEYSYAYWSSSDGGTTQIYLGANAGSEPTWKSVRALTATDSAAFGFTTHTYYKAFYDWTFLKNLGIMSLNQDSLVDSTLYISILFMSDNSAADSMEFTRKNNLNATESVTTYNWGFHTCWTPIDSTTVNYIRHHVTKNGIAN